MLNLRGSFLLLGSEIEPQVHVLSPDRCAALDAGLTLATKYENDRRNYRREVFKSVFGVPADYAVPAWSYDAMVSIATDYKGPGEQRARWLAACIVLGRTFDDSGSDTGYRPPNVPPSPVGPRPGGATVEPGTPTAESLDVALAGS